ncbi:MAG: hypothetical protein ACLGHO_02650 [Gammaproteobacteria bacterium]
MTFKRLVMVIVTYVVALVLVAVAAFFVVIFLAGPHADVLPQALEVVVLILGWLAVLVLPMWAAWAVWRGGRSVPASDAAGDTDEN